jgi:hypothetical protein
LTTWYLQVRVNVDIQTIVYIFKACCSIAPVFKSSIEISEMFSDNGYKKFYNIGVVVSKYLTLTSETNKQKWLSHRHLIKQTD